MLKNTIAVLLAICSIQILAAQTVEVYPTNWYTGMKWNKVQILLRSTDANFSKAKFRTNYPGVTLTKQHSFENGKYVALDVAIASNAKPGNVVFTYSVTNSKQKDLVWPLLSRRKGNGTQFAQGVTNKDLMYLIMPDRFANGDYTNDKLPGFLDQSLDRDSIYHRHGGDLLGIQQRLDYLTDLGVTALWLNPVLENNMPNRTEHGYAFTNHYKIDARLGGDKAYENLVNAAHTKGLKVIQDAVYNHIGSEHFIATDAPSKDWLHQWPTYTNTHYKDQTLFDPYASKRDREVMSNGWFVPSMPDVNQNNPFVANFLIQHALWTVERFGIDGWRIDTYAYNDLPFMNACNAALYADFPKITLFGETWVHGVINQAYFCDNNLNIAYKSNLQATTDFQTLFYGIQDALTKPFGWTDGVNKLYTTLAQDVIYKDPTRQVIFLDNHDIARFYSVIGEDTAKYKMALAWLLTCRGIPQLYYGNEILMTGFTNPDGNVRLDFKGGWKEDTQDKFTAQGRTAKENSIWNYLRTLAQYRKNSSALTTGKFMQYLPDDGLYVYFRYSGTQTVACIMNTSGKVKKFNLRNYEERTNGFTTGVNIVTKQTVAVGSEVEIGVNEMMVLELKK
ncbi:MAG: alpha-amylase [Bacteroidetes bacterium]|nr:MAG: alpha-amylase [Bacteroidota bacterium]TAF93988.1 MAG: alpha-amylase [Bacteroidota bacterium]